MRIISSDARCSLEVTRDNTETYSAFAFSGAIDIGHGQFSGANQDVHFLNLAEFVASLNAYISDRTLTPTLNGTYNTFIKIWTPDAHRTTVMLSFAIADAYAGTPITATYQLEGAFEINQDMLSVLLRDFRELANAG